MTFLEKFQNLRSEAILIEQLVSKEQQKATKNLFQLAQERLRAQFLKNQIASQVEVEFLPWPGHDIDLIRPLHFGGLNQQYLQDLCAKEGITFHLTEGKPFPTLRFSMNLMRPQHFVVLGNVVQESDFIFEDHLRLFEQNPTLATMIYYHCCGSDLGRIEECLQANNYLTVPKADFKNPDVKLQDVPIIGQPGYDITAIPRGEAITAIEYTLEKQRRFRLK